MKIVSTTSKTLSFILAISVLLSSCASTTLIDTIPSGADLYLNGEYAGITPHSMTDTKVIGTCTTIKVEKEGYHNYYSTICRSEEIDAGAIVGGIFFFFPFFWAMKYKPTHYYKLQSKSGSEKSASQKSNDEKLNVQKKPNDGDSLDQLWKPENSPNDSEKSVEEPSKELDKQGIIKLEEGNKITPEEFELQKSNRLE